MIRSFVLSLCLASLIHQGLAQDKLEFSGYTKDLLSVIHINDVDTYLDNLIHNRSSITWSIDTAWTLRADLRTRLFFGEQVESSLFDDLVEDAANDVLDLSVGTRFGDRGYIHSYFDRLYLQYTKDNVEIRLGRQRINWGINTLWNPNDIFNAYAFTDFDYEERPGSDAISIRYFTGELSSVEVIAKAGHEQEFLYDNREGAVAGLWRTHMGTYDLQLLAGYLTQSENIVLGGGWAGNLKNWGFKGEGSIFIPGNDEESIGASVSVGWDYVFKGGTFLGFGGLYNALGRTKGTLEDLFAFELSARNLYPFRWTMNAGTSFTIHPLVIGSVTVVYSIASSHPVFLSPSLTWSAKQNLDIDLVGQFVLNEDSGKYRSPVQAGFVRVKWSY